MGLTHTPSDRRDAYLELSRSRFTASPLAFAFAVAALVGGIAFVSRCGAP
jgi:hypothetical protein